jgi:hypothetical protein
MFRDDSNIKILPLTNDADVETYIRENNLYNDLIKVGFDRLWSGNPKTFDIGFYNSVNIPFDYRFTKFKFERDYESEKKIIEELNPNNEEYVFVHDDINRGFSIDRSKIRQDLKIIENNTKYNFFHMLGVIENSKESHLMQSSFKDLINSLSIDKPQFFYHTYVRQYPPSYDTEGYNKFTKIN